MLRAFGRIEGGRSDGRRDAVRGVMWRRVYSVESVIVLALFVAAAESFRCSSAKMGSFKLVTVQHSD